MMQASPTRYLVLYPTNRRVISVISVVLWDSYRLTPLISPWLLPNLRIRGMNQFFVANYHQLWSHSDPIFGWSPSSISYSLCSMVQISWSSLKPPVFPMFATWNPMKVQIYYASNPIQILSEPPWIFQSQGTSRPSSGSSSRARRAPWNLGWRAMRSENCVTRKSGRRR